MKAYTLSKCEKRENSMGGDKRKGMEKDEQNYTMKAYFVQTSFWR